MQVHTLLLGTKKKKKKNGMPLSLKYNHQNALGKKYQL